MMEYRGIEYTVVQGIERGVWKWSASVSGLVISGQQPAEIEAVAAAEKAIDRALVQKRCGLSRCLDAGIDRRSYRASIGAIKAAGRMYPFGL